MVIMQSDESQTKSDQIYNAYNGQQKPNLRRKKTGTERTERPAGNNES